MSVLTVPEEYKSCCAPVIEYMYIGDKKAAKSLQLLEQLGITHIVNVTPPKQQGGVHNFFESDERFSYLRLPVVDSDVEDISPYFHSGLEFIHQARKQGHSVLIHCQQGVSRSATIVIAYLICKNRDDKSPAMDLKSAYTLLKTKRPNVKPKSNFLKQLISFDQQNKIEKQRREREREQEKEQEKERKQQTTNIINTTNVSLSEEMLLKNCQNNLHLCNNNNNKKRSLEDQNDFMFNECNERTKDVLKRKYTSHYFTSNENNQFIQDKTDFESDNENTTVTVRNVIDNGIHVSDQ